MEQVVASAHSEYSELAATLNPNMELPSRCCGGYPTIRRLGPSEVSISPCWLQPPTSTSVFHCLKKKLLKKPPSSNLLDETDSMLQEFLPRQVHSFVEHLQKLNFSQELHLGTSLEVPKRMEVKKHFPVTKVIVTHLSMKSSASSILLSLND
ncbi:hypothetical protein ACH5RR_024006 [Cinchona calisaya]|uniref:Uncharacterized protein n=1 Tax=Cinchona calisaya TaxID=153742 RepID=A0ABD2ZDN4_9GENT